MFADIHRKQALFKSISKDFQGKQWMKIVQATQGTLESSCLTICDVLAEAFKQLRAQEATHVTHTKALLESDFKKLVSAFKPKYESTV